MIIKLDVAPDAEVTVEHDSAGRVTAVLFKPTFSGRKAPAVLAYGENTNDGGQRLDRFSLTVSGATGLVKKTDRAEPVTAAADEGPPDKDNS